MTREELEAIKAREKAASLGPWTCFSESIEVQRTSFYFKHFVEGPRKKRIFDSDRRKDSIFAAHARQDIPALITALEEAWAEIEKMREDSRHESMDRDLCE